MWTRDQFMIAIDRQIRRLFLLIALFVAMFAGRAAFGQDDDLVDDAIAPPPFQPVQVIVRQAQFNPEQVDQWVFSRWGGAQGARTRMEANLELRIDDLERGCEISEIQKKKLKLAGLGDIKRYYDRVEELKRKYSSRASRPNQNNNIWQELQPLQIELNSGLFGDDSIFAKTVKNTLTGPQVERHEDLSRRRATERRRSTIELFVVQIDKALGLAEGERERLIELLLAETPAPRKYGQADYWYFMYQMTRLPESKLRDILDEPQWRLLNRQFIQARGMEPWLNSNGLIDKDESKATSLSKRAGVRVLDYAPPTVRPAPVAIPKK